MIRVGTKVSTGTTRKTCSIPKYVRSSSIDKDSRPLRRKCSRVIRPPRIILKVSGRNIPLYTRRDSK